MAIIELQPHNENSETWLLVWAERQEIVGRVRRGRMGGSISPLTDRTGAP